jgi:hypothetical protein
MISLPLELHFVIRKKCIIRKRRYFNDFKETLVLRHWNGAYCRILAFVLEVLVLSEEIIDCATCLVNFQLKMELYAIIILHGIARI